MLCSTVARSKSFCARAAFWTVISSLRLRCIRSGSIMLTVSMSISILVCACWVRSKLTRMQNSMSIHFLRVCVTFGHRDTSSWLAPSRWIGDMPWPKWRSRVYPDIIRNYCRLVSLIKLEWMPTGFDFGFRNLPPLIKEDCAFAPSVFFSFGEGSDAGTRPPHARTLEVERQRPRHMRARSSSLR